MSGSRAIGGCRVVAVVPWWPICCCWSTSEPVRTGAGNGDLSNGAGSASTVVVQTVVLPLLLTMTGP